MLASTKNAWHYDAPTLSAKARIDVAVTQKRLAIAKQIIQAQDAELKQLRTPKKPAKTFKPVHPAISLEIEYRRKIECLIDAMNKSVLYWLRASFKANEPEVTALAQDALPATVLRKAVRKLARRWQRDFNTAAWDLGNWFGRRVYQRSTRTLHKILKQGGWTVDLKLSAAQRDILHASINENVSLIKSIPSQYFTQVEGMVMRSVTTGRDLHQLTTDLQRNFRVTRRRAELIARDQNNKVNSSLQRARQIELGIEKAVWVHSGGGKHPRPTHVRQNGKEFDIVQGWYDPTERKYIHPGQLINCRCVSRSVIPGFS